MEPQGLAVVEPLVRSREAAVTASVF